MSPWRRTPAAAAACLCAGLGLAFLVSIAAAQDARQPPAQRPAPAQPAQDQGIFGTFGRWLDQSVANINATFRGARDRMDNISKDAGTAARNTADAAKDAAGAVARLPYTRVVTGHERCVLAPNGAPDCIAAAVAVCKSKGFETGKSIDMTTAEKCPARVYLSGRQAGDCTMETFVSRALCQ